LEKIVVTWKIIYLVAQASLPVQGNFHRLRVAKRAKGNCYENRLLRPDVSGLAMTPVLITSTKNEQNTMPISYVLIGKKGLYYGQELNKYEDNNPGKLFSLFLRTGKAG
jgi:hypothetical protein